MTVLACGPLACSPVLLGGLVNDNDGGARESRGVDDSCAHTRTVVDTE